MKPCLVLIIHSRKSLLVKPRIFATSLWIDIPSNNEEVTAVFVSLGISLLNMRRFGLLKGDAELEENNFVKG